ncbi:hypothetical protein [Oleiagrimonas sp. MCCC 1A03011]|uniref:hypothetical protein n=1 Tax=Oleiagrimonas sp. MCCC 1A03011 TaxID=1926883 RepID=UPI0011BF417C|nr:hypothetical protein [Oleiagrimonas sp. MCCC 1A03011]
MIASDDLGKKGEHRFSELCADAGLIVNGSKDCDKAGWDFSIDFDFDEDENGVLDQRSSPLSCRVQQKTILDKNNKVVLPLKMAERLAKFAGPAYISVLKVADDLSFTAMYLMHIDERYLEKILRRLREEAIKGKGIKNKTISFKLLEEDGIAMSGVSLMKAMREAIGKDPFAYAARKQGLLKSVGYKDRAITARMKIVGAGSSKLGDMFLGLSESIDVSKFELWDERFGLSLKLKTFDSGKLSIEPIQSDEWGLVLKRLGQPPARLSANICRSGIVNDKRVNLKCAHFSMLFDFNSRPPNVKFTFDIAGVQTNVDEWVNYWRLADALRCRDGGLEVQSESGVTALAFDLKNINFDKLQIEFFKKSKGILGLFEALSSVLNYCNGGHQIKFDYDSAVSCSDTIMFLDGALAGGNFKANSKLDLDRIDKEDFIREGVGAMFVNYFILGEIRLAYFLKGVTTSSVIGDEGTICMSGLSIADMRVVNDQEGYDSFVANCQRQGIDGFAFIGNYMDLIDPLIGSYD